jgi:hypothetical protein
MTLPVSAPLARTLAAAALAAATWLLLRRRVRAPFRPLAPAVFDAAVLCWCLAVALAFTARPLLAAAILAASAAGLALADRVKRATLHEPLVFADRAELIELVRHPRLYLPFAGTSFVLSATAVALAFTATLAWLEPALPIPFWSRALGLLGLAAIYRGFSAPKLRRRFAPCFARWTVPANVPSDPSADMRRLGMLGGFVVHATLAAHGRKPRQYQHLPSPTRPAGGPTRPMVLVQAESFFDPRRLDLGLGEHSVPNFAALMAGCVQHGRLAVPCWGANTVRTEFEVLTGIDSSSLGLDRFNPYERFARAPIDSIAWRLRGCGYATICVHPFDPRFYGRHRALRQLGFDRIVGPEAFARPPAGAFVSDRAVMEQVAHLLAQHGPRLFVFVITMATHGPWTAPAPPPRRPRRVIPGGGALEGYLRALQQADAALPALRHALTGCDGVLALYGDHQPSLPRLAAFGIDTTDTDYLIWDSRGGLPRRRDLAAAQLAEATLSIATRPRLRLLQAAG